MKWGSCFDFWTVNRGSHSRCSRQAGRMAALDQLPSQSLRVVPSKVTLCDLTKHMQEKQ